MLLSLGGRRWRFLWGMLLQQQIASSSPNYELLKFTSVDCLIQSLLQWSPIAIPFVALPSQVPSHSWWLIPQVLSDLHISWHFSTCSSSPLWFFCSSQPVPDVTLCEGSAMVRSTAGDMSKWAWQSWNLEGNSAVATRDHKFCRTRLSSLRKGGKTSYHIVMIFLTMKLR
jgi:hypothetical protein